MTEAYIEMVFKRVRQSGYEVALGLSDREVDTIEDRYDLRFPHDLRRFLHIGMPLSGGWMNWRDDSEEAIRKVLDWPADGICFDIEHSGFWRDDWGLRPSDLQDAFAVARASIAAAPTLVPIYGHRYIPDEPFAEGNPVYSVYQTDIIHYGFDLTSYFVNELNERAFTVSSRNLALPDWAAKSPRPIRFWDKFL